jgi:hypothetical protein
MKTTTKTIYNFSSWLKVVVVALQIIGLVASQSTNVDPNDQQQLNSANVARENRALNTDSANEECPMCNSSEVSKT